MNTLAPGASRKFSPAAAAMAEATVAGTSQSDLLDGLLGDLVYRPAGPLPYPLRAQVEALTLLVDRVNVSYGTRVVDHPLLEPVLAQAQTLREALLTLLLNPEFCPDDEDFDDEDLEREDAEPEAAA